MDRIQCEPDPCSSCWVGWRIRAVSDLTAILVLFRLPWRATGRRILTHLGRSALTERTINDGVDARCDAQHSRSLRDDRALRESLTEHGLDTRVPERKGELERFLKNLRAETANLRDV